MSKSKPAEALPASFTADPASLATGVVFTGHLPEDLAAFLLHYHLPKILAHSLRVAETARELALRYAVDPHQAEVAGWLHDCSAVIPLSVRLITARGWGVEILPDEANFPLLLHQKLSAVIARKVFNLYDPAILSAVGCHTTLKAGASLLDKIVFIADKLAWDQTGEPPYLPELKLALTRSLNAGALVYLEYLYVLYVKQIGGSGAFHPWARSARLELLSAG